jgi:NAD(P)-dependent dehydrogenase (short-subunit alcohol dehydrogenase family)
MGRLEQRVIVVTGGSRGLGEAMSRLFGEEGAQLVLCDVRDALGEAVASSITNAGAHALYRHLDVSQTADWEAVVTEVEAKFGKIDGLVNNAAVLGGGPILEHTMDAWEHVVAVNQTGTFLGMKHCIPAFQRNGGGAIVNISSCAGIKPTPGAGPSYAATKAAVRLMTKSIAIDFAKQNIRANSVHPGRFQTDMSLQIGASISDAVTEATPMGRAASPREIAYAALWLLSDEASFVTGAELCVDGGLTAV